jgi:hypothetical protein
MLKKMSQNFDNRMSDTASTKICALYLVLFYNSRFSKQPFRAFGPHYYVLQVRLEVPTTNSYKGLK